MTDEEKYCETCDHIEMCKWTPISGCAFHSKYEKRPRGEWEKYGDKIDVYDIEGHKTWGQKRKCTNCDFIKTYIEDFGLYSICPNCGSDNRPKIHGCSFADEECKNNPCKDCGLKEG